MQTVTLLASFGWSWSNTHVFYGSTSPNLGPLGAAAGARNSGRRISQPTTVVSALAGRAGATPGRLSTARISCVAERPRPLDANEIPSIA